MIWIKLINFLEWTSFIAKNRYFFWVRQWDMGYKYFWWGRRELWFNNGICYQWGIIFNIICIEWSTGPRLFDGEKFQKISFRGNDKNYFPDTGVKYDNQATH